MLQNDPTWLALRNSTAWEDASIALREITEEVVERTRWRVIREFAGMRGRVVSVDKTLESLAMHLLEMMHPRVSAKIYNSSNLPRQYRLLSQSSRECIVSIVRYALVIDILEEMSERRQVYYISTEWCMVQSVMDEYLLMFKEKRDRPHNDGNYHGLPNSARRRRKQLRTSLGMSIGG